MCDITRGRDGGEDGNNVTNDCAASEAVGRNEKLRAQRRFIRSVGLKPPAGPGVRRWLESLHNKSHISGIHVTHADHLRITGVATPAPGLLARGAARSRP